MYLLHIDFTTPVKRNFFSNLIKKFQKTKYSHVRLRWINSTKRELIYEASGSEVKFLGTIAQETHKSEIIKTYSIPLTKEEYRELVDTCMEFAGIKYGVLQVLGIALTTIFNLDKNPFSDDRKSQVCSELVGRVLERVKKYHIPYDLDVAGPKEIDKTLRELMKDFPEIELKNG